MIKENKIFCAYIVGTVLEWYDFALFGALAVIFSVLFFPNSKPLTSLLATFGVFASGFIMRPLGAILFGYIGDTLGRNKATVTSIFFMTIATVGIGLLPTYQQWGILSSVGLIFMRMLQGLSAGGEYPGIIVVLWEMAAKNKKSFISSFSIAGVVFGMLFGSVISFILMIFMSQHVLYLWGWRIPFLFSIVLGILGFYLRLRVNESIDFISNMKNRLNNPLLVLLKKYKKNIVLVAGLFITNVVFFYTIFIYYPASLMKIYNLHIQTVLLMNSANMLLAIILLPLFGKISDMTNRYFVMIFSAVIFIVCAYPISILFFLKPNVVLMYIGQMLLTCISAGFIASVPAISALLFPVNAKYTGISLGLNFVAILFGGCAPLIATFLTYITGSFATPVFFVIFSFIVGLISILYCKKIFTELKLVF